MTRRIIVNDDCPAIKECFSMSIITKEQLFPLLLQMNSWQDWDYLYFKDIQLLHNHLIETGLREEFRDNFNPLIADALVKIWTKVADKDSAGDHFQSLLQDHSLGRFMMYFSQHKSVEFWSKPLIDFMSNFFEHQIVNPMMDPVIDRLAKDLVTLFGPENKYLTSSLVMNADRKNKTLNLTWTLMTSPSSTRVSDEVLREDLKRLCNKFSLTGKILPQSSMETAPDVLRNFFTSTRSQREEEYERKRKEIHDKKNEIQKRREERAKRLQETINAKKVTQSQVKNQASQLNKPKKTLQSSFLTAKNDVSFLSISSSSPGEVSLPPSLSSSDSVPEAVMEVEVIDDAAASHLVNTFASQLSSKRKRQSSVKDISKASSREQVENQDKILDETSNEVAAETAEESQSMVTGQDSGCCEYFQESYEVYFQEVEEDVSILHDCHQKLLIICSL